MATPSLKQLRENLRALGFSEPAVSRIKQKPRSKKNAVELVAGNFPGLAHTQIAFAAGINLSKRGTVPRVSEYLQQLYAEGKIVQPGKYSVVLTPSGKPTRQGIIREVIARNAGIPNSKVIKLLAERGVVTTIAALDTFRAKMVREGVSIQRRPFHGIKKDKPVLTAEQQAALEEYSEFARLVAQRHISRRNLSQESELIMGTLEDKLPSFISGYHSLLARGGKRSMKDYLRMRVYSVVMRVVHEKIRQELGLKWPQMNTLLAFYSARTKNGGSFRQIASTMGVAESQLRNMWQSYEAYRRQSNLHLSGVRTVNSASSAK